MPMQHLIEAEGLMKKYGERIVINGVNFSVSPGEVVAIIGPNGAGKSTLIDLVLGLRDPDEGKVVYWAADYRKHIGVQLQSTPFFPELTVLENLRLFASLYGIRLSTEQLEEVLEKCRLREVSRVYASRLSGGQQKRLAIAVTVIHQPKLIFLDEPTAALDPRARSEIRSLIGDLARAGTAVVFTSHDMEEVSKLAHRVIFISHGRILAEGSPDELLRKFGSESLEALYLQLTR
jgi:ABC-2 type transport system ATP-binding protein